MTIREGQKRRTTAQVGLELYRDWPFLSTSLASTLKDVIWILWRSALNHLQLNIEVCQKSIPAHIFAQSTRMSINCCLHSKLSASHTVDRPSMFSSIEKGLPGHFSLHPHSTHSARRHCHPWARQCLKGRAHCRRALQEHGCWAALSLLLGWQEVQGPVLALEEALHITSLLFRSAAEKKLAHWSGRDGPCKVAA